MSWQRDIRNLVLPLWKWAPVWVTASLAGLVVAGLVIRQLEPRYRASGAIQINLQVNEHRPGDLFEQGAYVPPQTNKFLTEAEVFKSRHLRETAAREAGLNLNLYTRGDGRWEIADASEWPLELKMETLQESMEDQDWMLQYLSADKGLVLFKGKNKDAIRLDTIAWGEVWTNGQINLKLERIPGRSESLRTWDQFAFSIPSKTTLMEQVAEPNLMVKPVDKDIPVLQVYFEHPSPQKARDFVNALMRAYMEDFNNRKTENARATLEYLEQHLTDLQPKLRKAESDLAAYKVANGLVNATLEADAGLKELIQLDFQKVKYDVEKAELERLFEYLRTGNNLTEFSPNFEALGDPIFKDAYIKIQDLEMEKQDLLMKYAATSREVHNADEKIGKLRTFLHQSIGTTIGNIGIKAGEVSGAMKKINDDIRKLPQQERQVVAMTREVKQHEELYNYLLNKREEIAIAETRQQLPHQIIEQAALPHEPYAPNRPLIIGISVLLFTFLGWMLAYGLHALLQTVRSRGDLLELGIAPVLATIYRIQPGRVEPLRAMAGLLTNIEQIKPQEKAGCVITIGSLWENEGKSFITTHLARLLSQAGHRVLLIDLDLHQPCLHTHFNLPNVGGVAGILGGDLIPQEAVLRTKMENCDLIPAGMPASGTETLLFSPKTVSLLDEFRHRYDYILIDTAPLGLAPEALPMLHAAEINLLLVRAYKSRLRKLQVLRGFIEEYQLENLFLVLNGAPKPGGMYPSWMHKRVHQNHETAALF